LLLVVSKKSKSTKMKISEKYNLNERDVDRIVEMGWEDRTTFDAIEMQFGVPEKDVIKWRKRVQGRSTKHLKKRTFAEGRHKCSRQKAISNNKISKR
jgi:uncharacterized protein (TIGR03643 family)